MPITNKEPHPFAGQNVKLKLKRALPGIHSLQVVAQLEDYWDRVSNMSWKDGVGNPAAIQYSFRAGAAGLPLDDDVVYVKINGLGHIVHTSEIAQ